MGCAASRPAHFTMHSTSQFSLDSKATSHTPSRTQVPDHVLLKRDEEEFVGGIQSQALADQSVNFFLRAEKPLVAEFKVYCAHGLPTTDPLKAINPYFRITTDTVSFCTKTKYGERNPDYDESFAIPCDISPEGLPRTHMKVELYDEANATARNSIAYAEFWTDGCTAAQLLQLDLPLLVSDPALAAQYPDATITVGIPGWILSYLRLKEKLSEVEGFLHNDALLHLYIPLEPHVYLGVEYGNHNVAFKVCVGSDAPAHLFPELLQQFSLALRARREVYPVHKELLPGLVVREEWRVENVPVSTDFRNWRALISNAELVHETSTAVIKSIITECRRHASLALAESRMRGVTADYTVETLFVPVENGSSETLLLVNWRDQQFVNSSEIKVAVLDSPAGLHAAVTVDIEPTTPELKSHWSTTCTTFVVAPRRVCNGKYWVRRLWDVEQADGMAKVLLKIRKFALSNTRQVIISDLLPLRPPYYPWY